MSIRTERVASEIQKILSLRLADFAKQKDAGIFTITAVKISTDLSIVKIYFSIYGGKISPQTFLNLLEEEKSTFRQFVGAKIRLRQTPELHFYYDDALEKIEHIEKLLSNEKKK